MLGASRNGLCPAPAPSALACVSDLNGHLRSQGLLSLQRKSLSRLQVGHNTPEMSELGSDYCSDASSGEHSGCSRKKKALALSLGPPLPCPLLHASC